MASPRSSASAAAAGGSGGGGGVGRRWINDNSNPASTGKNNNQSASSRDSNNSPRSTSTAAVEINDSSLSTTAAIGQPSLQRLQASNRSGICVPKCPICCEEYVKPKSLQCGHSVCGPCVESLFQSDNLAGAKQVKVTCPRCREQTGPFSRPKELSTNYQLMAMVEYGKKMKPMQSCENYGSGGIGVGGIGDGEPCFVCSQPTPKSEIWFCTSNGCSSQQSGLEPLCPECCIKFHNGHHLSLLTDELRQEQMRVYFDDFSTCLRGLENMENLDWGLLTKVLFNLAIVEYSADPVRLKNVHKDIGHLCNQMIGKGWLCKSSAAASKIGKRRVKYGDGAEESNNNDANKSKCTLLSNIGRYISTYFTMHRQKKQEENGSSSPRLNKCRTTIRNLDNFMNQVFNDINPIADKLSTARKRNRLCGFTKLIGEMYVVGVPNMDEWVDKCFHLFILVDEYDPSPTAYEMEAVLELINTIGATWMYRESARKGLISAVINQVIMDSIRVPDCSHIRTYAYTIQTRHEKGWRETDERGPTDLNSLRKTDGEMKELDDE